MDQERKEELMLAKQVRQNSVKILRYTVSMSIFCNKNDEER